MVCMYCNALKFKSILKFMVMISLLSFVSKNGSVTATHRLLFTSVHLYKTSVNRTSVKIFICFVHV